MSCVLSNADDEVSDDLLEVGNVLKFDYSKKVAWTTGTRCLVASS